MNYKHLNTFESGKIEALNNMGYSARKIAKILNRNIFNFRNFTNYK